MRFKRPLNDKPSHERSADIDAAMAEYLERGGEITQVAIGESGYEEKSWRQRPLILPGTQP